MAKPVILIAGGDCDRSSYERAVTAAGGDYCSAYLPKGPLSGFDGLLLCGGGDMAPRYFGQRDSGRNRNVDELRDCSDLYLIHFFAAQRLPILGVCRGMQVINVAFGGTICQDMEPAFRGRHEGRGGRDALHGTRILPGCRLHGLYGDMLQVNSWHHQRVDRLGKDLIATQWAEDGVLEGLEHRTLPVFGVQWHPERTARSMDLSPRVARGDEVFRFFIRYCEMRREHDREAAGSEFGAGDALCGPSDAAFGGRALYQ